MCIRDRKFISLIRSIEVGGFATRVDLGAYDKLFERVKAARPKEDHRYFAPFPKVLEMQLQFILKYVTEAFAGATRVNFVFDEGDRFAGSAAELIALHRKNPNLQGGRLLGAVSFGVSSGPRSPAGRRSPGLRGSSGAAPRIQQSRWSLAVSATWRGRASGSCHA